MKINASAEGCEWNLDDTLGGEGFADLLLLCLTQVILFEGFAVAVTGGIDDAEIYRGGELEHKRAMITAEISS